MPEYQRYVTHLELRVRVEAIALSGGGVTVGEYVVRGEAPGNSSGDTPVADMVSGALERVGKSARVMAAAVDNTERNRRK